MLTQTRAPLADLSRLDGKAELVHGAEREMAVKRADYFEAGTEVVWDVDTQGEVVIRSYSATSPERPLLFQRGKIAHAEPALPGWRMPVDDLFE